jgi:hypothetical protein
MGTEVELDTIQKGYRRYTCGGCGGPTNKDNVFPVFPLGVLCEQCIGAGPKGIGFRIIRYAEQLEQRAAALRREAEGSFHMPTLKMLEDARLANEEE